MRDRRIDLATISYYVLNMSAGSRGQAFTPTDNGTSAIIISDSCASDSLAHEIA